MVGTKSTLGSKTTKMLSYINYLLRVELKDGRSFVGTFLAYDAYMNIVLGEAKEITSLGKNKSLPPLPGIEDEDVEEERYFGLVVLRGTNIVTIHICGPPPVDKSSTFPEVRAAVYSKLMASKGAPLPGLGGLPSLPLLMGMQHNLPPNMAPRPGMPPLPPNMMLPPNMLPPNMAPRPGMPPLPPNMMPPNMAPRPGMPPLPPNMMPPNMGSHPGMPPLPPNMMPPNMLPPNMAPRPGMPSLPPQN
ncbi:hypothetical protein WA158_007698 [Blastocystis sp. Blastoise]